MAETIGTLEDVGKSLLICDNEACEAMFSFDRHRDGDPCPECVACRDPQPARLPGGAH